MNKGIITAVALGVALAGGNATAAPIDLDSVSGQWHSPEPDNVDVEYTNGGSSIWWGQSTGDGQSGYGFSGPDLLPQQVTPDEQFTLGTLTHYNRPITGDAITGVSLDVMADFSLNGDESETGPYQFQFTHDETPNVAPETKQYCFWILCWEKTTYTGDVDDIIYLDEAISSSAFELDGHIYSIDLLGFEGNVEKIETPENKDSSIDLIARLNVDAASVPEPGTIGLLGLGLAGLGFARRRRG